MDNITGKATEHGNYTYGYDELYRLNNADNPVQADEAFTYDPVGNRLTAAGVADDWSYNNNNELQGYDGVSFQHDANGNTTQKNDNGVVTNYIYNVEDRLERAEDGSGSLISSYYYDPSGRRLWKEVGGVRTYFVYADEGLIGEYDAAGVQIKAYGYKPGSTWTTDPLFMKVGAEYYFYQNDHLRTPQKLTAVNGAVVWSAKYFSFGDADVNISSTVINNLRFPGQYYDQETGLHYNWNRYYDPQTGRYLRTDPIGIEAGINLYLYVSLNPINWFDPSGLRRPSPRQPPRPFPGPQKPGRAPGASEPPKGTVPPFVGDTYLELYHYTLRVFQIPGANRLVSDVQWLTFYESLEIDCDNIVTYDLCFRITNNGVFARFLKKPGVPSISSADIDCVSIDVIGRKDCCTIEDVLKK